MFSIVRWLRRVTILSFGKQSADNLLVIYDVWSQGVDLGKVNKRNQMIDLALALIVKIGKFKFSWANTLKCISLINLIHDKPMSPLRGVHLLPSLPGAGDLVAAKLESAGLCGGMAGVDVWAIISSDWLWVALSAGSIPTTLPGPSGGLGCVFFLYLCVICKPCFFVFFSVFFWRFCRTFCRLTVSNPDVGCWKPHDLICLTISNMPGVRQYKNRARAPGSESRRVRESESAVQTPSFEHKKLPPHCECNSWPLEEKVGWELPSFCGNKQTSAIKQFPDGNKKRRRRRERGRERVPRAVRGSVVGPTPPPPQPQPRLRNGAPYILKAARQARERPLLMFNQAM